MLASVIGGILGGSDDEAEEAGREEEEGSDEEGSGGEDEDDEGSEEEADSEDEEGSDPEADVAAEPASAAADPFSRKRLQEKAAAGADAGADGAAQRQRAEPEEGATVFIRGLPLDVSKEQVFTKMKVREGGAVWGRACSRVSGMRQPGWFKGGAPSHIPACWCLSCTHSLPTIVAFLPSADLRPRALLPPGGGQDVRQAQGHRVCGLLQGGIGGEGGRGLRQGQVRLIVCEQPWTLQCVLLNG